MTAVAVDLHAHTVASGHAFSTLDELAGVAAVCGLEMIAITDHGPSMEGSPHDGYFEMVGRVPSVVGGVGILMGIEANIIEFDGSLDLGFGALSSQQVVLAGLHERTPYVGTSELDNTRSILRAMAGGSVHVVSHPFRPRYPVDVGEVSRAAADTGVLLEVNVSLIGRALDRADEDTDARRTVLETSRMLEGLSSRGGLCVVSSDAHHSSELAAFTERAGRIIQALEIDTGMIANRSVATLSEAIPIL